MMIQEIYVSKCLSRHLRIKLTVLFFFVFGFITQAENHYFRFSNLPALPSNTGYSVQPGLAGPYTGMDDGVLIVAGGANFPDKLPWEGGTKMYYDEIFILKTNTGEEYTWGKVDGYVYVAGGLTKLSGISGNHFFRLQMPGNNPLDWTWEALPPWEGKPRAFAVGVGQSNGETNCFYLFREEMFKPDKTLKFFTMLTFIIPIWNNGLLFQMGVR